MTGWFNVLELLVLLAGGLAVRAAMSPRERS